VRAHYIILLIPPAIINRVFCEKSGGKLGGWKSNVTDESLIASEYNIQEKKHDWLVLRIHDIMENGELVMTDIAMEGARFLFDGERKMILRNLENASKKLGNGFRDTEKFFRYRKELYEIDVVGFDERQIVGVEVKYDSGHYVRQLTRFMDYAEVRYPMLRRKALFYSGRSGLYLIKGTRKIPL
jgi:hypothetical protein